jgi:hypothetical protein
MSSRGEILLIAIVITLETRAIHVVARALISHYSNGWIAVHGFVP